MIDQLGGRHNDIFDGYFWNVVGIINELCDSLLFFSTKMIWAIIGTQN